MASEAYEDHKAWIAHYEPVRHLPSRLQVAGVAVVAILGGVGCFVGLLAGPDEEWAERVYVVGLALVPVAVFGLALVLRIRQRVISEMVAWARELELQIHELFQEWSRQPLNEGHHRPFEEEHHRHALRQAVEEILPRLQVASWNLQDSDAPRQAEAVAEAIRGFTIRIYAPAPPKL